MGTEVSCGVSRVCPLKTPNVYSLPSLSFDPSSILLLGPRSGQPGPWGGQPPLGMAEQGAKRAWGLEDFTELSYQPSLPSWPSHETDTVSYFVWVFLWRVLRSKLILSNIKNKILFCSHVPIKHIFQFLSFIFSSPQFVPHVTYKCPLKEISSLLFHPSLCLAWMAPAVLKCLSPSLPVSVPCIIQGPSQISPFPSRSSSFPSTEWDPSLSAASRALCSSLPWQLYSVMPFPYCVLLSPS